MKEDQPSTIGHQLFNHFLKLCAENIHLTVRCARLAGYSIGPNKVATERDVKPVAFLTFDDKVTPRQIWRVGLISSSLSNNVDKEVPSPGLSYLCEGARDRLLLFLGPGWA